MYRGKHNKQTNGTAKKLLVLLVSFLLIVGVTAGGTLAYLIASDGPITNTFTPSKVTTEVTETFQDGVKSNVKIKNTGDTEAYIRAAIVVTWKDAKNGNVYGQKPVAGDYTLELNLNDWIYGADEGVYYYKYPVAAGKSTNALITSCAVNQGKTPAGYGLNVEILGSGIQSVPADVVAEQWGVTVDNNGNIKSVN